MHLPRAFCTAEVCLRRALLTAAHSRLSALMASSHSESLFEAVLITEAELASEAARPNPQGVESEAGVVSLN